MKRFCEKDLSIVVNEGMQNNWKLEKVCKALPQITPCIQLSSG